MNCYVHDRTPAVGLCVACQKAICRECVGQDAPRLVCRSCREKSVILGFEYRSNVMFGSSPLVHVCMGIDAATMRPKIAKGVASLPLPPNCR
jgi:hypothetical protein